MTFRRFLFVSHRYVGLVLALFLLVASVTGCLLVFRDRLDALLNPGLFEVPTRPVLPATTVAARLAQAHPGWRIRRFALATFPGMALRVEVAPLPGSTVIEPGADELFVDPTDARLVGARRSGIGWGRRHLLGTIYVLHFTLLAGTPGRWLMGAAAFGWLVLNLAGLFVTWPRRPPRGHPRRRPLFAAWRGAWVAERKALARRPLPELHRVAGLWLLPLLVGLALTSVSLNFYGELVRPAVEWLSPPRAHSPWDETPVGSDIGSGNGPVISYARAVAIARADAASQLAGGLHGELRGWLPVSFEQDSARDLYGVAFSPDGSPLYEGFGHVTLYLGQRDGRLVWIDQPRLDGRGRRLLRALYPLHSGQVFGLPTRLLVLLLGLATIWLAVSGVLPWWRRRRLRGARQPRPSPEDAPRFAAGGAKRFASEAALRSGAERAMRPAAEGERPAG